VQCGVAVGKQELDAGCQRGEVSWTKIAPRGLEARWKREVARSGAARCRRHVKGNVDCECWEVR
jgi:hypothetical protein